MDFRKSKLADRYLNDASFHQLVSVMEDMIHRHGFTPSELREAVFMAHYKYEMENPEAINRRMENLLRVYNLDSQHESGKETK